MPVVDLSDAQLKALETMDTPIADQIFMNPITWGVVLTLIIVFIFLKMGKKTKDDPATKPFHGRELRGDLMKKEYDKRLKDLGQRTKHLHLEKGTARLGVIERIEYDKQVFFKTEINERTKQKKVVPDYYQRVDRFKYREHGIVSLALSLLGMGYKYMCLTPDCYNSRREKNGKLLIFSIDPAVHLISDSGIWTVAQVAPMAANKDIILKAHHEDLHGSEIDFLRRLAVHSPGAAVALEKLSHEAQIKEQERQRRTAPYQ